MSNEAVGMTLEQAVHIIVNLRGFPIALWSQGQFNQYNEAFETFWKTKPSREQFNLLMHTCPVTADMLWVMTRG